MKRTRDNAVDFLGTVAHYVESLAEKSDFAALLRYYEDNRDIVDKSDEIFETIVGSLVSEEDKEGIAAKWYHREKDAILTSLMFF